MKEKVYSSIQDLIGGTPLLELRNTEQKEQLGARVLAKLEYFNPAGSVKDRVAKAMLDDAEAKGLLTKDSVIIEPTSGNTGIGLASVAAAKGYKVIIVMPETMSIERRQLMKAYGAELVLTEGAKGMKGAIAKAKELAEATPGSFIPGQFTNPATPTFTARLRALRSGRTPQARSISLSQVSAPAAPSRASANTSSQRIPTSRSLPLSRQAHPSSRPALRALIRSRA